MSCAKLCCRSVLLTPSSAFLHENKKQGKNLAVMAEQIKKFKPKMVSISDGDDIQKLKDLIKDMDGDMPEILYGADGKDQRK